MHPASPNCTGNMTLCYLQEKDWSPRFADSFFTFTLNSRTLHNHIPEEDTGSFLTGSSQSHPAIYYNIVVKCGKNVRQCPRRYSQFHSLYEELRKTSPRRGIASNDQPLHIPGKTCFFQTIDEDFLDERQEDLARFLDDVLKRPYYVSHPTLLTFLGFDS